MDPISLYSGLFALNSTVATIVNVALGTKEGRKTLDSTLKELPILFSLLEEMGNGVLKTETTIPQSAARAFRACQADLENLIECLSQRGLMPFRRGREGFSGLKERLSDDMAVSSILAHEQTKKSRKDRLSFKEKLHLLNLESLIQAVKKFKDSVLLLRHIAMDFQTHAFLISQATEQQIMLGKIQNISSRLNQTDMGGREEGATESSPDGHRAEEAPGNGQDQHTALPKGFRQYASPSHSLGAVSTISRVSDPGRYSPKPSDIISLKAEKFSTVFNVMVAIPKATGTTGEPIRPDYVPARTVLDTGSAKNMISEKMVARHRFNYLKRRLDQEATWTLGDGKTTTSSEYIVELTWYNTHDAMRSYWTKFYVVVPDIFDMLLGKEFYSEYGPPKSDDQYYLGYFDLSWRSKEQRKKETDSRNNTEKMARDKLQQARSNAEGSIVMEPLASAHPIQPVIRKNDPKNQITSMPKAGVLEPLTNLSPVPEQPAESERHDVMVTPANANNVPKQEHFGKVGDPAVQRPSSGEFLERLEVTGQGVTTTPSSTPDLNLEVPSNQKQKKPTLPSLDPSIRTIEGSDPETPDDDKPHRELALALSTLLPTTTNGDITSTATEAINAESSQQDVAETKLDEIASPLEQL